jgi:hypothetical protein
MDHLKLIPLLFLFSSSLAFASAADFSGQSPFFRNSAGTWINSRDFANQLNSNTLTYDGQYRVQSPTTGRAHNVPVVRTASVDVPRVGSAVSKFAKALGPVAVGVAVGELICELSDICDNAGEWFFGTPSTDLQTFGSCETVALGEFAHYVNPANGTLFEYQRITQCDTVPAGWGLASNCPASTPSCFQGDRLLQKATANGTPPDFRAATDQDWIDAEPVLSDPQFVQPLFDGGEDLPVLQPDSFPPVNTVTGEKTTTLKDGAGNTIGTQTETTTITLTDNSTVDSPNNFDIKEEKTVTNFDINNNITDQSTTINEAPPSEAPAEDDVTFDEVSDTILEEKVITAPLNTTSWGGGTCPAPIAMNTSVGNFEFDTQPFCDFAEALKPFILIVASILGAFIILRARKS